MKVPRYSRKRSRRYSVAGSSAATSVATVWALLISLTGCVSALVAEEVSIEGTVLPFKSVTISSPVEEIIVAMPVEEGDTIGEGEVLAELRSEQEKLELQRYDKLMSRAKFEADAAQRLFESGTGTESAAIESRTDLERLQSERDLVELRLTEKTIRSPIKGIVVDKLLEAGESVEQVEDMFEVINIDRVFIRFYIDAIFLKLLKENQTLSVRFPLLGDSEVAATVDFLDSRIDPASGLVEMKLLAENPDHKIKAGMRAMMALPDPNAPPASAPVEGK